MTFAVAVTFAPSGDGARWRRSNSTPTLRSSVSRNGAIACRAVRSKMPTRFGVLSTAGIPSVANSMQCFCSTTNVVSPTVPILGADFILNCRTGGATFPHPSGQQLFPSGQLLRHFLCAGGAGHVAFRHGAFQIENTQGIPSKAFINRLQFCEREFT